MGRAPQLTILGPEHRLVSSGWHTAQGQPPNLSLGIRNCPAPAKPPRALEMVLPGITWPPLTPSAGPATLSHVSAALPVLRTWREFKHVWDQFKKVMSKEFIVPGHPRARPCVKVPSGFLTPDPWGLAKSLLPRVPRA